MDKQMLPQEEYIVYEPAPAESGQLFRLEEYYRYYDTGNITAGLTLNDVFSTTIMVLAHKSLKNAIEEDLFDDADTVLFDMKENKNGRYSAYIIRRDIEQSAIKKNDVLILDVSQKVFSSKGLYITVSGDKYAIKYLSENCKGIAARVVEIHRKV